MLMDLSKYKLIVLLRRFNENFCSIVTLFATLIVIYLFLSQFNNHNLRIGMVIEGVRLRRSVGILTGGDSEKLKVCQNLTAGDDRFDSLR